MTPSDSVQPAGNRQEQDSELILRIKSGDKLAFSDFFDRFSRPVHSVAFRILNDRSEAEDVVQDTFLTVWEKAGSFDEARGFALDWVLTLTRNRAIERLRMRPQPVIAPIDTVHSGNHSDDLATGLYSANHLSLEEKILSVRKALATLPADQLQVLELAYFGGLNPQDFSSQGDEPTRAVRTQIRRGLLKLRDLLTRTS